jgi:FtsH-binding integral membrane protein
MGFIGMTYLHLTGALALTAVSSEYPLSTSPIVSLVEFVAIIAIIFLITGAKPGPYKYFLFAAFAILIGQTLAPLVDKFQAKGELREVLFSVAGIFLAMTAVGFLDNQNILGFGPYLFAALIGLVLARIILLFTHGSQADLTKANSLLNLFATGLFAVYVAYDTQLLKQRQRKPYDYVNSSMGLFLDIINLFAAQSD